MAIAHQNVTVLLRFLYLGSKECVLISKRKSPVADDTIDERLGFMAQMVCQGYEDFPLRFIRKVLESDCLQRRDECLLALAYCVRRIPNEILHTAVYTALIDLLVTDDDLFKFVDFYITLAATGSVASKSFGKGMRRMVNGWYKRHTAMELANMFGRHRGLHRWSHKDLFSMCHVSFDADDERLQVMLALLPRGCKVVGRIEDPNTALPTDRKPSMQRLCQIFAFKVCEDFEDAARLWTTNHLEFEHIPSHMYDQPKFWLAVLPKLNYGQLLSVLWTLHDQKLLVDTTDLAKKMCVLLGKEHAIVDPASKVQPLQMLSLRNAYRDHTRYAEFKKNQFYLDKKVTPRELQTNTFLVTKLAAAINHAISNVPRVGLHFFITLDLKSSCAKRRVFNMGHIRCMEAMALIALILTKREKSKIYTFTGNNQLQSLNFKQTDTYEMAYLKCLGASIKKTSQSLAAPFAYATDATPKIFITIMDSVARICRQGLPSFPEFERYQKKHPKAKYIVLNLGRNKQDLSGYPGKGVLEICGLTPDTFKVIHAFCTNQFS